MKLTRTLTAAALIATFAAGPVFAGEVMCDEGNGRAYTLDFLKNLASQPALDNRLKTVGEVCVDDPHSTYDIKGLVLSTPFESSYDAKDSFDSVRDLKRLGLTAEDIAAIFAFVGEKEAEADGDMLFGIVEPAPQ